MKPMVILCFLLVCSSLILNNMVQASSVDGLHNAIIQRYGQEKVDLFKQCEGINSKPDYIRTTEEKTQLINMQRYFLQDSSLALSMHINKFLGVLPILNFSNSLISNIMHELVPKCHRLGISSGVIGSRPLGTMYGISNTQGLRTHNVGYSPDNSFDFTLEQIALSIKTAINAKHRGTVSDMVALAEETDWLRRVPRKTEQEIRKVTIVVDAMRKDLKLAPSIKMLKLIRAIRKLGYLSVSTLTAIAQDLSGQCKRLGITVQQNSKAYQF